MINICFWDNRTLAMATVIATLIRQYYKSNRTDVSGTVQQLHGLRALDR